MSSSDKKQTLPKENIVVVGGYGHVGQSICRRLGELYPGKVFAAGRSLNRAEQFCRTTDGKVRPMQLDVMGGFDPTILNGVKLIVMCLDQWKPCMRRLRRTAQPRY